MMTEDDTFIALKKWTYEQALGEYRKLIEFESYQWYKNQPIGKSGWNFDELNMEYARREKNNRG